MKIVSWNANCKDDCLDKDGKPIITVKAYYFWKPKLSPKEYFAEANRHIDFSNTVIANHDRKLLEAFKYNLYIVNSI